MNNQVQFKFPFSLPLFLTREPGEGQRKTSRSWFSSSCMWCGLQRSSSSLPHLVVKPYPLNQSEDLACLIPLDPIFVEDCFPFFRQHSALAYRPEHFSLIVVFIMRSPRSLDNLCWSLKLNVFQAGYELDVFPRQDSKSVSCLSFSAVGITCERDLLVLPPKTGWVLLLHMAKGPACCLLVPFKKAPVHV